MEKRRTVPQGKMESSRHQVIDYRTYELSKSEILLYGIIAIGICGLFGMVFYHSIIGVLVLFLFIPLYLKEKKKELCEKRKRELNIEFKEMIHMIAVNLRAGYSVENAFRESYQDCCLLFGKESLIAGELFMMIKGLDNNVVLETGLNEFGKRSGVDSIRDFCEIFQIAKRTGGDLNHIIQETISVISEKIEVETEIDTILTGKKYEQKIMNFVPIFIILYIQTTSPGFFEPMYHNVIGILIMTICIVIYGFAYYIGKKITNIKI